MHEPSWRAQCHISRLDFATPKPCEGFTTPQALLRSGNDKVNGPSMSLACNDPLSVMCLSLVVKMDLLEAWDVLHTAMNNVDDQESRDKAIAILISLRDQKPTVEELKTTKIGHIVTQMTHHPNAKVSLAATL